MLKYASQEVGRVGRPLVALFRELHQVGRVGSEIPLTKGGAAFENDLRGTSGVGAGDGLTDHTDKWLDGDEKSPMQYIHEVEPIKVDGLVAISHGRTSDAFLTLLNAFLDEDPALGCPTEYIDLKGTSYEHPAVCKYTGYRFYSDAWKTGGAGH